MTRLVRGTLVVLAFTAGALGGFVSPASAASVSAHKAAAAASSDVPPPATPSQAPATPAYQKDPGPFDVSYTPQALYATRNNATVNVCVPDSGANPTSSDAANIIGGYNQVDGSTNVTDTTPDGGHGTNIVSTIPAIAPNSRIFVVKATTDDSGYSPEGTMAAAIQTCIMEGAQVINLSRGSAVHEPQVNSMIDAACAANISVVIGSGNGGTDNPADDVFASDNAGKPCVIVVGGWDPPPFDRLSPSANFGSWVDTVAPMDYYVQGVSGLIYEAQTSFTTPQVVGTVALMKGLPGNANLSASTVKSCIVNHGTPIKTTPSDGPHNALNDWGAIVCAGYQVPLGAVAVKIVGRGHVTDSYQQVDCPGTCAGQIYAGQPDELDAFPAAGYKIGSWSVAACKTKQSCTATSGGPALTVTFVKIKKKVKVTAYLTGPGKAHASIKITGCGVGLSRCLTVPVDQGTKVTITVNLKGAHFVKWVTPACRGQGRICVLNNVMKDTRAGAYVK